MNKKREPSSLATTIALATTLAISLSTCLIAVSEAVRPYLLAAFEAARFAP